MKEVKIRIPWEQYSERVIQNMNQLVRAQSRYRTRTISLKSELGFLIFGKMPCTILCNRGEYADFIFEFSNPDEALFFKLKNG